MKWFRRKRRHIAITHLGQTFTYQGCQVELTQVGWDIDRGYELRFTSPPRSYDNGITVKGLDYDR